MTTRELLKRAGLSDEQIADLCRRLRKQRPKPRDKMRRKAEDK